MITKKSKMYFETEDYSELTDFYNDEAKKQADSAEDYGEDSHELQMNMLTKKCIHDKKVFDWRQMHRDKYEKYLAKREAKRQKREAKLQPPPEEPAPEEPQAEQPTKVVECTALDIIDANLLTCPTEADPSTVEDGSE